MAYLNKHYTHVQLIAYEVPTLRSTTPGAVGNATARIPVPNLPDADSRARLTRLAGVINYAANRLRFHGNDTPNTLKVIMVPEFYFRPINATNAYTFNQMQNIAAALREMFIHPDFADWLIVAGSIFSTQPADAKGGPLPDGRSQAYFNTTRIIKGGATDAPFNFVHKRLISGIDGAPPNEAALNNPKFHSLLTDWKERKQNVFQLDNRTFGIEVCLDHLNHAQCRTLKTVLVGWQGKEGVAPPLLDVNP